MSAWLLEALGESRLDDATTEASRRLVSQALSIPATQLTDADLRFTAHALELAVYEELGANSANARPNVTQTSSDAFQLFRVTSSPAADDLVQAQWMLRTASLGVLGDRGSDASRYLKETAWPELDLSSDDWGIRVESSVIDAWLRIIRKDGWNDLNAVYERVATLRQAQAEYEERFLGGAEEADGEARVKAWRLVVLYHLARAVEVLGLYSTQGEVEGRYDIRQLLEAQFDRALLAAQRGDLMEEENLARLLSATALVLVENNIWTVTRAVNSRVTRFVNELVRNRPRPLIDMLAPQRRTLRDQGLLGSSQRSVVVSLPTSSGKTLIAQFRILQALNQFDQERGWVAYVVPTRALVNQITTRLRRDFSALGIVTERVSPALEVDALEAALLTEASADQQFRILVTTPEKLDLMIRGGWESTIGRPLTLVVVDEAHNLAQKERGIKLELLLATINRESRNAQFLLMTPFIDNASDVASWLDPQSSATVDLEVPWRPNDRAILTAQPRRSARPGDFSLEFKTIHTSRETLDVPDLFATEASRPLGLTWSMVSGGGGTLAAAVASTLEHRGSTIILAGRPDYTWPIAAKLAADDPNWASSSDEGLALTRRFVQQEFGSDFALHSYLAAGVGVHHAGLSDELKGLTEWLFEKGSLRALVATTTIAQGVNFPVENVVFATHQYPYGEDMPPQDFWNIAGRAGRVEHGSVGVITLVAGDDQRADRLRSYVQSNVAQLNSRLLVMLAEVLQAGDELHLETLFNRAEWSAFLQYIAHTYRQIADHDRFSAEVEQILRGTLGFQTLRERDPAVALRLLQGVFRYAERLTGKPLALVDATGFSWESVSITLNNAAEQSIDESVWDDSLFTGSSSALRRMMGVLLEIPEIRENLEDATGGRGRDGDFLASLVAAWVSGATLPQLAAEFFSRDKAGKALDPTAALTRTCQNVFGRLAQTAAWGLSALQALTVRNFDELPEAQQRALRNLPAKVYYGVSSDEAIALRVLGVPRGAAVPVAQALELTPATPIANVRERLFAGGIQPWERALGPVGRDYEAVWRIVEGLEAPGAQRE